MGRADGRHVSESRNSCRLQRLGLHPSHQQAMKNTGHRARPCRARTDAGTSIRPSTATCMWVSATVPTDHSVWLAARTSSPSRTLRLPPCCRKATAAVSVAYGSGGFCSQVMAISFLRKTNYLRGTLNMLGRSGRNGRKAYEEPLCQLPSPDCLL